MTTGRALAIGVAVISAGIGAIQLADPADFGMTTVMIRWLGVLSAMLAVLAGFLPRVQGPTTDPGVLADRVAALPDHDQQMVVSTVASRASTSDTADAVPLLAGAVGSLSLEDRRRLVDMLAQRLQPPAEGGV